MQPNTFLRLCFGLFLSIFFLASLVQSSPLPQDISSFSETLEARGKKDFFKGAFNKITKKGQCKNTQNELQSNSQSSSSNLENLWKTVPEVKRVATGRTRKYELDPNTPQRFATTEFFGCTIVTVMDGRNVFIGHFAEENHCGKLLTDEATVENVIIGEMENYFNPGAWSSESMAYILYKPQGGASRTATGLDMLKDEMVRGGLRKENVQIKPYAAVGGAMADTSGPKGKVLVDWTKNQGGGNHLAYYAESDRPLYQQNFDAQGNPCAGIAEEECES
ncbi:hypothetical protein SI65_09380 [Aspergillus cristatus]|uniref:Uncharacterized protein n=1 Tax=Aspergillus cristatus TaxID=573508 RepID=A0A1E3B2U4_ASPCR|nr:hypothetical protein SI65_09380 [Aspergillus cristatus]